MRQPSKWKEFEKPVARVQADLAGNGVVTHNDKIIGNITGVERQIDVSIRGRIGQYDTLIVIECKDLGRPLDVKDVEEFIEPPWVSYCIDALANTDRPCMQSEGVEALALQSISEGIVSGLRDEDGIASARLTTVRATRSISGNIG